jgi:hypothetical protein
MPYIGRAATNAGSVNYLDDISSGFDGNDVTFTCAVKGTTITPGQENVYIYLDGVFQHPGESYTISGSTITFTEAPVSGVDFTAYVAGEGAYLDDGTVSTAKLDDDAVTASKLDDDGTGFQVGDLGVGGSLTSGDKLTVTGRLRASGGIIGDLTGNVTGNTSGTAATVTGAAQSAITSVGTLSSLTLSGDLTLPQKIVHSGDTDTYLSFGTDSLSLYTGGTNVVDFIYGNIYIKENNKALVGYNASGSAKELIKIDGSNVVQIGEGLNTAFSGSVQISHGSTPDFSLNDTGGTTNRRVFRIAGGGDGIYFEGRNNDNSGDGDAGLIATMSLSDASTTFAGQTNFGTTASFIKQSNFGYSSSYKVLQLGLATSTSAISLGADLTGNASGGFTGNEIVIPNARGILAPNGANNAYLGVLGVTSANTIEIGRGNHSIVTEGNGAISINTSNDNTSFSGDVTVSKNDAKLTIFSANAGDKEAIVIDRNTASNGDSQEIRWKLQGNNYPGGYILHEYDDINNSSMAFGTRNNGTPTTAMSIDSNSRVQLKKLPYRVNTSQQNQTNLMSCFHWDHPDTDSTSTFDFNPVSDLGLPQAGGSFFLKISGWMLDRFFGLVTYRNNGGSGDISSGSDALDTIVNDGFSVGISRPSGNTIRIQVSGQHNNSHGWDMMAFTAPFVT